MEIYIESGLRLTEVARTGNIGDLYALIKQDPKILERINENPFADTPFHIAAVEGQINFAMEVMNLKPSFAKKLNQDGFSPMHLAVINGHTKLVLRLLKADKDLVRVKGREGMTPLHYVVKEGDSNLLYEFLEACPECIEDVTVQGETALHVALKRDQMEAFKLLIGWLQRSRHGSAFYWETKIVNWRDNDDNTVLHVAAREEQHQALKLLLDSSIWLDVKAKNCDGLTALDIVQNVERSNEPYCPNDAEIKHLKTKVKYFEKQRTVVARAKNMTSMDMINVLMVIVALVITATYQSSLSPPRGVWQGDNISTTNTTTITSNVTQHFLAHNSCNQSIAKNLVGGESRKAGTTIMNPESYLSFWIFNCVTFGITIFLTIYLLSSVPLLIFLLYPLSMLGCAFFYSMSVISPSTTWSYINTVFIVIFELLPLFVFLLMFKYSRKIIGQQAGRVKFLEVLGKGNNSGIIQSLKTRIKATFLV